MPRGGYRPGSGRKPKKPKTELPQILAPGTLKESTPLEYMLAIMNDPTADPARRDRMAVAAAPFFRSRVIKGKKDDQAERAGKAATGRFAPCAPPKLKAVK